MEDTVKSTVTISLSVFDTMRKTIEEYEKGNVVRTMYYQSYNNGDYCGVSPMKLFMTKDEAVKEIAKDNEELQKHIDELQKQANDNYAAIRKEQTVKNKTIFDVRNMSIWEFLSWRKR